jgi:thiamine-monophosphate kinase
MTEAEFHALLLTLPLHDGARGLLDDAAVIDPPVGRQIVLTHDVLVEGVHFLPTDPAGDIAWKLVAVNLSDLAAKGAVPIGVMLGYPLGQGEWDAAFADGLRDALIAFAVPLIGGDTVRGPRVIGMTALGHVARGRAPSRTGARPGDGLWMTGRAGAAGLGLIAAGEAQGNPRLVAAYRRPWPRISEGQALAPLVNAMADISDGVLIDAARMARASGLCVSIDLATVPIDPAVPRNRAGRLAAVTAGDDYELLFAADVRAIPPLGLEVTRIGRFETGAGLSLHDENGDVPLPRLLGWEHRG